MNANLAALLYLVAGVLFILSLRGLDPRIHLKRSFAKQDGLPDRQVRRRRFAPFVRR